jgi:hypothetical protein
VNVNEREKELSRITGFLNAEFSEPMPGGKWKHGLTTQGYEMVLAGYACGHCLAMFDRFTLVCPACQTWHDVGAAPQETPQHWLDHLAERYAPVPYDKPTVVNPFMANDTGFMERIRNNPDVEQIDLTEQTKKTRRK